MNIYWGDPHCHCAASYGSGTPARALANARQHLDFCSLTGHAFWPDMPLKLANRDRWIVTHLGGFAKLQVFWKDLMRELDRANVPGRFVTLPSYEWHSCEFGDYNVYFDTCRADPVDAPNLKALARRLKRRPRDSLLVPHHCGYPRGFRGLNWDAYDPRVSPLIEVFSNHGCGEADDAPYEYHHSMGPRVGESMVREGLLRGHRFGFLGGTDSHDGYPGHYGHGRTGVLAPRLDRPSIWKSLKQRRTVATTGARIAPQVRLGSAGIGQVVPRSEGMPLGIRVEGTAPIDKMEIVEAAGREWRIRRLPIGPMSAKFAPGRYKVKVETGWGFVDCRSDWNVKVRITGGRLLGCDPCFRFSAYEPDEQESCDRIMACDSKRAEWQCRAMSNPAGMIGGTHFHAGGTQAVVLDIDAGRSARLRVAAGGVKLDLPVADLAARSVGRPTGGIGSPAVKVHRAVPEREFSCRYEEPYAPLGSGPGFVYLRVSQCDGQVAWTSPIWFE